MANGVKVLHEKNVIEMSKAFDKASSNPHSSEYALLQRVRHDYPDYRLVVRKPKNSKPQGLALYSVELEPLNTLSNVSN